MTLIHNGEHFDTAILDMRLRDSDGLALARDIRRERVALPLMMLTSLGRREVGEAVETIGFAAFLTKPIKPSQLFDALITIFTGHSVPSVPTSDNETPLFDPHMAEQFPLRILLAEDNMTNQKLALRLLARMGYRADVAGNGLEVLASLQRQSYDVVLMDMQMPEMDGLEAARQIREKWAEKSPHIIAMTANAMQGDRELCLAAGMNDYVSKPIQVKELVSALKRSPSLDKMKLL